MLPKKSISQIVTILRKRKLEDCTVLNAIERILIQKRGYSFRAPKAGTPVVSLLSGGLDTVVVTEILMKEHGLIVYPVYINRKKHHSQKTQESIQFFSQYFSSKYPRLFRTTKTITIEIPPPEIFSTIYNSQNRIIDTKTGQRSGIPSQPALYAYAALLYARTIEEQKGISIRNIIGGWIPSNSDWYAYETLTAFRTIMLELCTITKDYSWQFTSLPMEKNMGYFFDKEDLIRWGAVHNMPLEKTWTCSKGYRLQCGACILCSVRQARFRLAGISDHTQYLNQQPSFIQRAKRFVTQTVAPPMSPFRTD